MDKALAEVKAWGPAKGLPGIGRDKLPKRGEARWISFKLTATTNQLVWLTFSSEQDSEVLLNGETLTGDVAKVSFVHLPPLHRILPLPLALLCR